MTTVVQRTAAKATSRQVARCAHNSACAHSMLVLGVRSDEMRCVQKDLEEAARA